MKNVSALRNLRVTGILCLLSFAIPILNWIFVLSTFVTNGSHSENLLQKELLFKFNIVNQIITAICILMIGSFLHFALKSVNAVVSFTALVLKIVEGSATLMLAFVYLIGFSLFKSGMIKQPFLENLIGNYIPFTAIPGLFFGLSMFLFSKLFLKVGIIPKWLSIIGCIAFSIILIYDTTVILSFDCIMTQVIQIIGSALVSFFLVYVGFYLIFKKNIRI